MNSDRFEDIMSAAAFAEAGEHETAREMLRSRKRLLLALSDRFCDRNVFGYALSACRRMEADLIVLYLARSVRKNETLSRFAAEAKREGIGCEVVRKDGCMKKAILDLTEKRRDVLFVIVGTTPELDIECRTGERTLTEAWKKLKCPLVVVSKGGMPSVA